MVSAEWGKKLGFPTSIFLVSCLAVWVDGIAGEIDLP